MPKLLFLVHEILIDESIFFIVPKKEFFFFVHLSFKKRPFFYSGKKLRNRMKIVSKNIFTRF